MSKIWLGIDIGTTSLKAAAFDSNGNCLKVYSEDYKLITRNDMIEFDAEEYWNITLRAIENITSGGLKISGIAVDTQGETLIVTDENGKPLRPAIVWLDNRAEKEARQIEKDFTTEYVYEMTGQPEITAGWPASKLIWIKNNEPETWKKTKKIFMLADYINYRLTNNFIADKTLQSSTIYFDLKKGGWWKEMLDYIGISEDMLPELRESGVQIGEYKGIPVATGALDQIAACVGAGIINNEVVSEMTGTTLAVCATTDSLPKFDPDCKVPCHYSAIKDQYCLILWSPTAGMALKWFKNNFCENFSFKELDELAKNIPQGCNGLTMIPYLCGATIPRYDPNARGEFKGIALEHTRGHFVRAILEAVAQMLKDNLDYIDFKGKEIRSMGGGASSDLWCSIKANMTGKTIVTLKNKETACLGSAILAAVSQNEFKTIEEACKKFVAVDKTYQPHI